jgi:site-specific recombinase XerD
MERKLKRNIYVVKKALRLINGDYKERAYIYTDDLPVPSVNMFLERKSKRSYKTGVTYAYHLKNWLNFLSQRQIRLQEVSLRDFEVYIDNLTYGPNHSLIKISLTPRLSRRTVTLALTVVQEFYKWMLITFYPLTQQTIRLSKDIKTFIEENSGLYDQLQKRKRYSLINVFPFDPKPILRQKIWLTEKQKTIILDNLKTFRDKAIFMLLLEGMRIDEVLSLKRIDYDAERHLVQPNRSKGREIGKARIVCFSDKRTEDLLIRYILAERSEIEKHTDFYTPEMFLNIKRTKALGAPVTYRNYWEILVKAGRKAGLWESNLTTHVGRRTKVQELMEARVSIDDICVVVGWRSRKSIESYKDPHNARVIKQIAFGGHQPKSDTEETQNNE